MPTPKEIAAEIKALKKLKPLIPAQSVFQDDNHAAVDAQIEVLQSNMSEDDIYTRADDGVTAAKDLWSEYVRDNAICAWSWKTGTSFESASVGWEPLIQK
jgi:hypothetical protein